MSLSLKQQVAAAALPYLEQHRVIGIGTGSTVNCFIDALVAQRIRLEGAVSSSEATTARLIQAGIPVIELNHAGTLPLYIDGADEFNAHKYLVKGGGAALTREKIVAAASQRFVCLVDASKRVDVLGRFPVPIEVIPMARSFVAREIIKLNGDPVYRQGVITDNGNVILDVHNWQILDPVALEQRLNNIPGIVTNGLFAQRGADVILCAYPDRIETIS